MLEKVVQAIAILALVYAQPVASKEKVQEVRPLDYTKQVGRGEKVFRKCVSCHSTTKNKMGPSLENLFGRTAGTVEGYKYSKAMRNSEIVWNEETLKKFLKKPSKFIKGNKMRFRGIRKESQVDALIAYLKIKLGFEALKVE